MQRFKKNPIGGRVPSAMKGIFRQKRFRFYFIIGISLWGGFAAGRCVLAATQPEGVSVTTEDGAMIKVYYHHREESVLPKDELVVLVHGINAAGEMWYAPLSNEEDYLDKLTAQGYDVAVIDKRANFPDALGPKGWRFSYEDEALDVKAAISAAKEYFNGLIADESSQVRDYTQVSLIGHAEAAQDVTCYTRSPGYRDDIKEIFLIAPEAQGGSYLLTSPDLRAQSLAHLISERKVKAASKGFREFMSHHAGSLINIKHLLRLPQDQMILMPGASPHPEPLLKALDTLPFSPYMDSLGYYGPLEGIPFYIVASESDVITGYNQIYWSREEKAYEYIPGLKQHSVYQNLSVLDAIIKYKELGPDSGLFTQEKAFPPFVRLKQEMDSLKQSLIKDLGMAVFYTTLNSPLLYRKRVLNYIPDHPDESFSVTTRLILPAQSPQEVLDIYVRLARKKEKILFGKYYDYTRLLSEAQAEFDLSDAAGLPELFDEWSDRLNQGALQIQQDYREIVEQTFAIPDAAVLANGFAQEMMSLIQENSKEPVRIINETFSSSLVETQPILIIPSGGLHELDNSPIFRAKLREYVKQGGMLICFAQPYGHEYSALPGAPVGYGWRDEQACRANAVYIDNNHQIFAGQKFFDVDAAVDGYFTRYPDDATVLLRRTENNYPAMMMYPYGEGQVIAATLYEDWAYGHSQSTAQARVLIRDMVSWAKRRQELPQCNVGGSLALSVTVKNRSSIDKEAAQVKVSFLNPDREIVDTRIVHLAQSLAPGLSAEVAVDYAPPAEDCPLGIWWMDYGLMDVDGILIQPRGEGEPFVVRAAALQKGKHLSDFQIWMTASAERISKGDTVMFGIHVKNNTDSAFSGGEVGIGGYEEKDDGGRWWVPLGTISGLDIPAHGESVFTWQKDVDISTLFYFGLFADVADIETPFFYGAKGFVTKCEKDVRVIYPSVEVGLAVDKPQYSRGEDVAISLGVENTTLQPPDAESPSGCPLQVRYSVVDCENDELFSGDEDILLDWAPGSSWQKAVTFSLPPDVDFGTYLVQAEVSYCGQRVAAAAAGFEVPSVILEVTPQVPDPFIFNSTPTVSFTIENLWINELVDAQFSLKLKDPEEVTLSEQVQTFSLAGETTMQVSFDVLIDTFKLGSYTLSGELVYEGKEYFAEEYVFSVGFPVNVVLQNSGSNDITGQLILATGFWGEEKDMEVTSGAAQNYEFFINTPPAGAGTPIEGGDENATGQEVQGVDIPPAEFTVVSQDISPSYQAGDIGSISFFIKNTGGMGGMAAFDLDVDDIYKESQSLWIMPQEEKELKFDFVLAGDLEEKTYPGQYSLNGIKGYFSVDVKGVAVDVTAQLDKAYYRRQETAVLSIDINSMNSGPSSDLFVRVQYDGFEEERSVPLQDVQTVSFNIPVTKTGEKVFYGVYTECGRSLYLNSAYIYGAGDIITLYTDKQVYDCGQMVIINIDIEDGLSGILSLAGPDYQKTLTVTGHTTETFLLPLDLHTGTYDINYTFALDDGTQYPGAHDFDVRGLTIKINDFSMDKDNYNPSETIAAVLTAETNQQFQGLLKCWIVGPEGNAVQTSNKVITLGPDGINVFNIDSRIVSSSCGIHWLIYAIYDTGGKVVISGAKAFDLGQAVLVDIVTGQADYPRGDEDVEVAVSFYGNETGRLRLFIGESQVLSENVVLNGMETRDFIIQPPVKGRLSLKAELEWGNLLSVKTTQFKYGCVSPPAALTAVQEDNTVKLSWQASPDEDIAGYRVYYGSALGEYSFTLEAGDVTVYELTDLEQNNTYYIAVTAYNNWGDESVFSNEVSINILGSEADAFDEFRLKSMTIDWSIAGKDKKREKKHWEDKTNFSIQGELTLPEGYTSANLMSSSAVSIQIDDEIVKDEVRFKKDKKMKKHRKIWRYSSPPSTRRKRKDNSYLDITEMTIYWDKNKRNRSHKASTAYFYIKGIVDFDNAGKATLPAQAQVCLAIPTKSSKGRDSLMGKEVVAFQKNRGLWQYQISSRKEGTPISWETSFLRKIKPEFSITALLKHYFSYFRWAYGGHGIGGYTTYKEGE